MTRTGALALLALFAGCASQPRMDDALLADLVALLPGSYDNLAQVRRDPGHPALRLMIAPVSAPRIGEHVFYVQEMAADDARRVFSQRLFVLQGLPEGRAMLGIADFTEASRWRDGHLNRDLFKGLLPQDVRARAGCEVILTREGDAYRGEGGASCRVAAAGSGETLRVEQQLELDGDGLALLERQRDAAGVVVATVGIDSWHRFARRADAPW